MAEARQQRRLPETLAWIGDIDGHLRLVDQTRLPGTLTYCDCHSVQEVWTAIQQLVVRGAPAIGIAAAYGYCLGAAHSRLDEGESRHRELTEIATFLGSSRPTAVNLFWALDRMQRAACTIADDAPPDLLRARLLQEARRIHDEDRAICHAIGTVGAELLADGVSVLTHCNAGSLATAEYGTALAVLYAAQDQGKRLHVYVDETRPLLQGARLTAWELQQRGISATLICDSMAAQVMRAGRVQAVITGADRIAANGDTANKIGTYGLAVLAAAHAIPFYVAAPASTFDLQLDDGSGIPIEERASAEVTHWDGHSTAPPGIAVYNPAFDVTPARYLHGIITERGLIQPVNRPEIRRVLAGADSG